MTSKYPAIGERVTFARSDEKGEVFVGSGLVQAIFLNPDKREMVQVRAGADVFNIYFSLINYSSETLTKFKEVVAEEQRVTLEGNALVKGTINEYNQRVANIWSNAFGDPVDFPDAPPPAKAENGETVQ